MSDFEATDLIKHLGRNTVLSEQQASQVVAEVLAYFNEDTESFIRRRHREMQQQGYSNTEIFTAIQGELRSRLFPAASISERQIRRMIYG